MARSRNIKPGFFKNYELADAGPLAQLLFAGLWTLADREGRLLDRPRLIKAELFPYYDCDVNRYLTVIARLGNIQRYVHQHNGENVHIIQVVKFLEHQSPHHTEKASTLPKQDASSICYFDINEINPVTNGCITVNSPLSNGGNPPDSLIPDSLIPDSLTPPKSPKGDGYTEDFLKFWNAYPNKQKKGDAFKAWKKLKPSQELVAEILSAVEKAKGSREWQKNNGEFIPHPSSWLNGRRWEDQPVVAPTPIRRVVV